MKKMYQLNIDEDQAHVLIRALDVFSRIGLGQFEEVLDVYDRPCRLDLEQREEIRAGLKAAKLAAGHPSNGSYGIHNESVRGEFRDAFDLQQVIRHRIAWDNNPKGGIQVHFDEPRRIGDLPMATIRELKPPSVGWISAEDIRPGDVIVAPTAEAVTMRVEEVSPFHGSFLVRGMMQFETDPSERTLHLRHDRVLRVSEG